MSYILVYCGTLWYNVVGAFADTGHHSSHPVFAFFSSARARAYTVVGFRHLCDVLYHGTLWYIVIYCGTLWHNVVGAFADTGHHSTHPVFAFFSAARARADTVVGFRHLCDVVYYGTLW